MKKDYFFLELIKSGPFILLMIIVFLILLGFYISNHNKNTVVMKEDVMYIAPKPKK